MERRLPVVTFALGVVALLCGIVMFMAGHDVWHDVGRPDIWNLPGPPYADLRAFGVAFYLLLGVLLVHVIVSARGLAARRRAL